MTLLELVLELPGGGLLDAETPTELDAGDALLALGHVIHGAKPHPQAQLGGGEDGARDRRGLHTTGMALEQISGLQRDCLKIGGQAAITVGRDESFAGWNLCPNPEPRAPF